MRFDRCKVQCYNCGDTLLMSVEEKVERKHITGSDFNEILLMITTNFDIDSSDSWCLDTNCSNHTTRN